jgi:hypothetical protein
MTKSEAIKEALKQVQREVDRWPSWLKTNEIKETSRQSESSSVRKLSK